MAVLFLLASAKKCLNPWMMEASRMTPISSFRMLRELQNWGRRISMTSHAEASTGELLHLCNGTGFLRSVGKVK